jgi:hypothetical protein
MYAVYARRFNWTPEQVDAMPLEVEQWMLPLMGLFDEVEAEKRDAH